MIELGSGDLEALCADPAIGERLGATEGERQAAVRQFLLRAAAGLAAAVAAAIFLYQSGWVKSAFFAFVIIAVGAGFAAFLPLNAARDRLKHPVLAVLGRRAGLDYFPSDFEPPALASACDLLFGRMGFSSEAYSDLFNGKDEEGHGLAVYEACLKRRVGKSTYVVFSGQIYAVQRRPGAVGETVIVPDRNLLNFWTPASELERVPIEGDPYFEDRFEVYSTHPIEARDLLFDSAFRARLLELREQGRVWLYAGPEEALVAVSGGEDRFEPGSMLSYRPGEDRVKLMFDDFCASLALLGELKAKLG
ncbi:MAG TPA: DUF3137 domain-containing protein [Allosphingosinicella sp.]|nr:DUF3137 domain-containing protein [Allosphingosinicella sp.]